MSSGREFEGRELQNLDSAVRIRPGPLARAVLERTSPSPGRPTRAGEGVEERRPPDTGGRLFSWHRRNPDPSSRPGPAPRSVAATRYLPAGRGVGDRRCRGVPAPRAVWARIGQSPHGAAAPGPAPATTALPVERALRRARL